MHEKFLSQILEEIYINIENYNLITHHAIVYLSDKQIFFCLLQIQLSLHCAVGVERQSDFGRFKSARFEPQINSSESEWKQDQRS